MSAQHVALHLEGSGFDSQYRSWPRATSECHILLLQHIL
jgi:hypothetical protein